MIVGFLSRKPCCHWPLLIASKPRVTLPRSWPCGSTKAKKPFLAKKSLAAITWTGEQAVQAIIDGVKAKADQGSQGVQIVYRVDTGKPRLRIIKAASTSAANPGDEVQFVLRFDNIGEQPIGNVTIIDSLTTRLEYIPDSHIELACQVRHQENFGESLVLRWEINEPIKAGDGGVIRLQVQGPLVAWD